MGRQGILALVCCLTLSQSFGDKETLNGLTVADNKNAESAPRVYRNVYASIVPHGSYSFHLPSFVSAPNVAASKLVPVKQNFVNRLTDSYGNAFVGTPQLTSYKIGYPQQYLPHQTKLPAHLAQPLVAASANFHFKPANGQFFGAPYRVPALQGPHPTPLHHFPTFGQLYGDNVKNLAPNGANIHLQRFPSTQQQQANNKVIYTNTQSPEKFINYKTVQQKERQILFEKPKDQGIQEIPHEQGEIKFQRIQEAPNTNHGETKFQRLEEASHSDHSDIELPHYESKFQIIQEQPHSSPHGELKFQNVQETTPTTQTHHSEYSYEKLPHTRQVEKLKPAHGNKSKLQAAPGKQKITYINDINGEKTIVELETKPTLPLLDLTLLEPLTFDNPLVPQVQHFLPRINQATYTKLPQAIPTVKNYQKEFKVEKTTSYDSEELHDKPQKDVSKKKQKKPIHQNKYPKKNDTPKKTITYHETHDESPEIVYEINSPNYKETVKQKAVSYNKQTQAEPISYTYGSKSEKEPVTYSYSRTSKEPVQVMNVQYQGNGPQHLIYKFSPEEHVHIERSQHSTPQHNEAEKEQHSSHESGEDSPGYHRQRQHTEQYQEHPQSAEEQEHLEPSHKENDYHQKQQESYHKENEGKQQEVVHDSPPKYYSEPAQFISETFQPVLKEYENNIRLLTGPSASIKVDPHQHVQHQPKSTPESHEHHEEDHSQSQQQRPHSSPEPNHDHPSSPHTESYNPPAAHIHEKSKRIIIHEETPDEMHMLREQMRQEVVNQEENSEEDFDKAYEDAAIGFPAYNIKSQNPEKDIFDPAGYGVPRDHVEYDFQNTPFQQYQEEGDEFPKETRSRYKDTRDRMKQNYYSDYSINKPENLLNGYQNKLGYYKLFKEQKPVYLVDDDERKQNQKSAKLTAAPSFVYYLPQEKSKSYFGQPKPKQQLYEYDYSKGAPRDNSAFASRPYQNYKTRTSFVEPQFQYGFEPVAIPKLLDSELAAMATNVSPESEKPGMRKKIYKENWYIKKTSTSAGAPAS